LIEENKKLKDENGTLRQRVAEMEKELLDMASIMEQIMAEKEEAKRKAQIQPKVTGKAAQPILKKGKK